MGLLGSEELGFPNLARGARDREWGGRKGGIHGETIEVDGRLSRPHSAA